MTKFGIWLKYYRNQLGKTQETLAREVGVRKQTISLYEHGAIKPSLQVLGNLAFALDVPVQELAAKMEE